MKRHKAVLAIATTILALAIPAQARLLLYEGFDYPVGETLDGQTPPAGMGMTGSWTADDHKNFDVKIVDGPRESPQWRTWDGIAYNVAQTGGFISAGSDGRTHTWGHIMLDSSVTDEFRDGAVTWMSFLCAQADVPWGFWPMLAIGAGELLEDRGNQAADQAIGGGVQGNSSGNGGAYYWDDDDGDGTYEIHHSDDIMPFAINVNPPIPYLMVIKITWSDTGDDTVEAYAFPVGEGSEAPTEEAFNAGAVPNSADLDQSLFDTLSYAGARFEFDEIRIGTTFEDILTGTSLIDLGEIPKNGSTVSPSTELLQWTLPDPNFSGATVTCDVWFTDNYPEAGLFPGDPNFTSYATKIVGQDGPEAVESVAIPITLERYKTYYWRIDTYDPSTDKPQPVIGPVFTFNTNNMQPVVELGEDKLTWLTDGSADFDLSALATDEDGPDPLSVAWAVIAEPNSVEHPAIISPSVDVTDITVTVTLPGTYELSLTAFDGLATVEDTITVTVYNDACEAAVQTGAQFLTGDFNEDCIVNLADLAIFAVNWMESIALQEP